MCTAAVILTAAFAQGLPSAQGQTNAPSAREVGAGAVPFANEDAVILRREQNWVLQEDGTVRRRERTAVRLHNSRPIRLMADPRIDFVDGQDTVIIHEARTILSSGEVVPVPHYSFNFAAPDEVAGWPQYASWRQEIVSFSGVEPGAVLELDYELVTPPGILPWMWGDVRIDDDYPTLERVVAVTVPEGAVLRYRLDGMAAIKADAAVTTADGAKTYAWKFRDLPGTPAEPYSFRWEQRCGRLRFTTCPDAAHWTSTMLAPAEQAARADEKITKFAEDAAREAVDAEGRMHKLVEKLHDSFNVITSAMAIQGLRCRPAPAAFASNYGNELEAAALYSAALKAIGVENTLAVGADAVIWDEDVPTDSGFAGVVVIGVLPDGESVHIHPRHGVFSNPGPWGRRLMLDLDESGSLRKNYVYARGQNEPSELVIAGKIMIDAQGAATGQLRPRLSGAFFDPHKLDSADFQKSLISNLVERVVSGFEISGHSVVTLSNESFQATADVTSREPLKSYDQRFVLKLGSGPAFLVDFPLPLRRSQRLTDVQLASRVHEKIDLMIELPEGWGVAVSPASPGKVEGEWGMVSQDVEIDGRTVRFRRSSAIKTERITPTEFASLREALLNLQAEQSLLLVFQRAAGG